MRAVFFSIFFVALALCACTNYKTTSDLNCRSGPGTNYPIKKSFKKGSTVCVVKISNNWAKLDNGNYVSAKYLKASSTSSSSSKSSSSKTSCTNYKTTTSVNVRSGPGTNYGKVKTLNSGATVCVVSKSNGWAKLNDGRYISAQYISTQGSTSTARSSGSGYKITASMVTSIFPNIKGTTASNYASYLNEAFKVASINTKLRVAHFLAQVGHESGGLQWFKEFASGKAYEGRKDLGNTQPGDGVRFKGRGPIQITGRANYKACGKALGLDLINNPSLLEQPKYGFRSAAWFWGYANINPYADRDDVRGCTKRVNGGYNGLNSRISYLNKAKRALGI